MVEPSVFEQMQEEFDYANITDKTREQNYRTEFVENIVSIGGLDANELHDLFPWWITTSIVCIVGLALLRMVVKISVDV